MQKNYLPSVFRGLYSVESSSAEWKDIMSMITGAALKDDTVKYRHFLENGFTQDAQSIKRRMLAFTPAVECLNGRKSEHIQGLTGVSMCDFDHVDNLTEALAKAKADPHSMLVYTTISGHGVRVLFRYTLKDMESNSRSYGVAFSMGNEYYAKLLGAEADGKCKNMVRMSVICHDSEAMLNEDSVPFVITSDSHKVKKKAHAAPSIDKAAKAVMLRLATDGVVYAEGSYNQYVSTAGYYMNMLGVDHCKAEQWALTEFADYDPQQVKSILNSCYSNADEFATLTMRAFMGSIKAEAKGEGGKSRFASVDSIETFLHSQAEFRKNIITRMIEVSMLKSDGSTGEWEDMTDEIENTLWARLCKTGQPALCSNVRSVIHSEFISHWNPFEDYFYNLPEWDGKHDYIGEVADMVHLKTDSSCEEHNEVQRNFREYFRRWLVSTVASVLIKDVINHKILVLIGEQGIYKTTFFSRLLPPSLQKYFIIKTNSSRMNKDDTLALTENLLICMEEIDSLKTSELNQLKALVTATDISERAAYDRYRQRRPHIASFCGTGNSVHFLSDQTGNRRWLPFEVENIDSPWEHVYDYTGIYSQAMHLLRSGMHYWFDKEEQLDIAAHLQHFEVANIEEELILTYYRKPEKGEPYVTVNATNIMEHINVNIKQKLSTNRIGIALHKLGYKIYRTRVGRVYRMVEMSIDEIQRKKHSCTEPKEDDLQF